MQEELLVGDLVRQALEVYPSRTALLWRDTELTYLGLNGAIDAVTVGLKRLGVQRGDRIALYTHTLPQFVHAYYALARLGAIAVPINIHWKGRDLHYLLSTAGVSGVITIAPLAVRIKEVQPGLPDLQWVVAITASGPQPSDTLSWQEVASDVLADPPEVKGLEGLDPVMIAFSAGMSGPPKAALLSHFNLLANCEQFADMPQIQLHQPTRKEPITNMEVGSTEFEVSLLMLPLTDLFSLNSGLNLTLKMGGTAVLMERFEPDLALTLLEHHRCTLLFGTPENFAQLLTSPYFLQADLSSLKYAFAYGSYLPASLSAAFLRGTGKPLFSVYGAVEASPVISCTAAGPEAPPESVGYPLGVMQATILDRQGNALRPGQIGQLVVQGPNIALGYFNPQSPAEPAPVGQDSQFNTGDMAQLGPAGVLYLADRREDVMSVQGRPVFPHQIERVLLSQPGVKEAAALPVEDGYGGYKMVAFIVPQSTPTSLTEGELMLKCRSQLQALACPQRIYLYEEGPELPRLPDGRIWRRALRTVAAEMPK
jgi:long-chain acyl-CoA synthetase